MAAKRRTTRSTLTRSPCCCAAGCCRKRTSTPKRCVRRAICCAGAITSCASAPSSSRISRTPRASTTCPALAARAIGTCGSPELIPAHFPDPTVRRSIELDLALIDALRHAAQRSSSRSWRCSAKTHDAFAYHLLRSIPGVGQILTLVLLYEIQDIRRFPRVQEFLSYARLVKAQRSSAGKISATAARRSATCI